MLNNAGRERGVYQYMKYYREEAFLENTTTTWKNCIFILKNSNCTFRWQRSNLIIYCPRLVHFLPPCRLRKMVTHLGWVCSWNSQAYNDVTGKVPADWWIGKRPLDLLQKFALGAIHAAVRENKSLFAFMFALCVNGSIQNDQSIPGRKTAFVFAFALCINGALYSNFVCALSVAFHGPPVGNHCNRRYGLLGQRTYTAFCTMMIRWSPRDL